MNDRFAPDDEFARRLADTLRQEADAMSIPDSYDELSRSAHASKRRQTTRTIVAVAAGVTVVALAGGWVGLQGGPRGTATPAGPAPLTSPSAAPSVSPSPVRTPEPTVSASTNSIQPSPSPTTGGATPAPTPTPPRLTDGEALNASHAGFASPSGNLVCTMDLAGVRCHAMEATWSGAGIPADRLENCDPNPGGDATPEGGFGTFGPGQDVILTAEGSFGSCVSEISVFEAVATIDGQPNDYGTKYRTWAGKDTKLVEFMPGMKAYVLPYGTRAVTGRFSCAMADTGITCRDTQGGGSFHLSRADLTLR